MATHAFTHLPAPVRDFFRSYARRKRLYELARLVVSTFGVYMMLLLIGTHIDRLAFLDGVERLWLFRIAHGATALWFLSGAFCLLLRRQTPAQLAYEIESLLPERSDERFVSLEALAKDSSAASSETGRQFLAQLADETARRAGTVRAAALVRNPALRRWLKVAAALAALAGIMALFDAYQFPLMVERFVFPARNLPKPSFVRLRITPENLVVGKGTEAVLQVHVDGQMPPVFGTVLRWLGMSSGRAILASAPMGSVPDFSASQPTGLCRLQRDLFLYSKSDVTESFRLQIRCGDAQTDIRDIRVVPQPRITELTLTAVQPAYAALPETAVADFSAPLEFLPETKVTVRFKTDQPVTGRAIRSAVAGFAPEIEWDEAARAGTFRFVLQKNLRFELEVSNADGFRNVEATPITLAVRKDQPPEVPLEYPSGDLELQAGELLPVRGLVKDDFGVSEIAIRYLLNPTPDQEQAPKETMVTADAGQARQVPLDTMFDLESIGAVPGDLVRLRVRGRDTAKTDGFSQEIAIRVVPFTRGDGERVRIQALVDLSTFLARATLAAKAGEPALAPQFGPEYDEFASRLQAAGLVLPKDRSPRAVLEFLEREHHFTESPRDRDTVRNIACVLAAEWRRPTGDPALGTVFQATMLENLRYRQGKNLLRQLLSMHTEIRRIHARFEALPEEPAARKMMAGILRRRGELYAKTLQGISTDCMTFARETGAVDQKSIGAIMGDMNAEAFALSGTAIKRQQRAAAQIAVLLENLMAQVTPSLAPLFARYVAATQAIDAAAQRALSVLPEEAAIRDLSMLSRSPFAGVWPRLQNHCLALVPGTNAPLRARLLACPAPLKVACDSDAAAMRTLSYAWQRDMMRAEAQCTPMEKSVELLLLSIEELAAAKTPDVPRIIGLFQRIQALSPALDALPADLALPENVAPAVADAAKTVTFIAKEARTAFSFPEVPGWVSRIRDGADVFQARLQQIGKQAEGTESVDPAAVALGVAQAAQADLLRTRRLLNGLSFAVSAFATGKAAELGRDDLLFLRMHQARARYEGRVAAAYGQMLPICEKGISANEAALLADPMKLILSAHGVLQQQYAQIEADYRNNSMPKDQVFSILPDLTETRHYREAAARLSAGESEAAVSLAVFAAVPGVSGNWLAAKRPLSEQAAAEMRAAAAALTATPPDVAAGALHCRAAADLTGELSRLLSILPAADWKNELAKAADEVTVKAQAIAARPAPATETELSKLRMDVGSCDKSLRRVAEIMAAGISASAADGRESLFRGGPDGIWEKELTRHADRTRMLLMALQSYATDRVVGALFSGAAGRGAEAGAVVAAWCRVRAALVYSDLYGLGGARRLSESAATVTDPHLQWLKREIDAALEVRELKHYKPFTDQYLGSLKDFLRY